MDDAELERTMRAGLERRAAETDVDVAVVDRARAAARGRRTSRLAVVGMAAAAVVAVAVTGVLVGRGEEPAREIAGSPTPTATDDTTRGPAGEVRTEYWHDVQVDVPVDWGWDVAPDACGSPPVGEPYVGRPILETDACSVLDPDATPTAPYVWFDAAGVEPGTVDLGGGYTRETVRVNGSLVSVATADPALRARILDSVAGSELCLATLDGVPAPRFEWTHEGGGPFGSARLCAYRDGQLVYAQPLGRRVFEETFDAVEAAPPPRACADPGFETVVLTGVYDDPFGVQDLEHDVVYDLSCGRVSIGGPFGAAPTDHQVTEATVPWAGPQYRHLLTGPVSGQSWVYERFIGMQG